MKTHHVWWPHMDREPLFNPFVPATQQRYPEPEPINADEEEQASEEMQADAGQDPAPSEEK